VGNPRVLFLDEPTTGLDAVHANEVMAAVKALTVGGGGEGSGSDSDDDDDEGGGGGVILLLPHSLTPRAPLSNHTKHI